MLFTCSKSIFHKSPSREPANQNMQKAGLHLLVFNIAGDIYGKKIIALFD